MPPADDTALARSQRNSSSAFLIVSAVLASVPGLMIETDHVEVYFVLQHCFHFWEHIDPRLHQEVVTVHTHACIVVIAQTPSFVVHIWLHRHCVPTSFHENFIAEKLLPQTCRFPRAVMSLDQQPHDSTIWLGFCWWNMRTYCLPCLRERMQLRRRRLR